jgi:subtilase family serine protease
MFNRWKRLGAVIKQVPYLKFFFAMILIVMGTQAYAAVLLTRHVREAVVSNQGVRFLKPMSVKQRLRLDVVMPLRDHDGLKIFLQKLYDPSSPSYRKFLKVEEFTAKFGPTQEDYDTVINFAKRNGFKVVGGSRNGMDIQIEGSVATIESAFHLTMGMYQDIKKNRTFYAPDREPTVDLSFQLWHISGLDNYSIPHPLFKRRPPTTPRIANTGSGPSNSFLGSDMKAAYYGGTGPNALTGAGQNLGLFEFVGTDLTDLQTYYKNIGQTNTVPVTLLSTDGTSTSCTAPSCDDTEQTLDMTQALGMAPGLASLVMYVGNTDTAILSSMTSHSPLPTTIGCSWGWKPADPNTLNPYFEKMAAQGQTFFAAAGDSSNWSSTNEAWPADSPYVVSVGGTDLTTTGAGGAWASETTWSDTGGGISPDNIAIPAWQQLSGVINSRNKGSTTLRNGPDVAANANFTFYVCANQTTCSANEYGGTSFAAPMWAGYVALANQQAIANGKSALGFINPAIYSIGVSSSYNTGFHDITSGESGIYSAVVGYDLVTGWGSMNGAALINALAGSTTCTEANPTVSISPASQQSSAGGTLSYKVTVTDNDSTACNASSFNLAATVPNGFTGLLSQNSLNLSPGTSGAASIQVTSGTSTASGNYSFSVNAVNAAASSYSGTGSATYVVNPPQSQLSLTVSPQNATFTYNSQQYATFQFTLMNGHNTVLNNPVALTVQGPDFSWNVSLNTGSNGVAQYNLFLNTSVPVGTYKITATATYNGNSVSGQGGFVIQE